MRISGLSDTIKWYDKNARHYANATKNYYSTDEINKFIKQLPKAGDILDAGCGSGRDSTIFSNKGFKVTGVDLSEGLLKIAQQNNPNIKFVRSSFLDMPFLKGSSYDGVWAHASLVHLETKEDVEKAIAEFYRVLRNKGILHILVKAQTGEEKTAVVKDALSKHDRFFQYFKIGELRELLKRIGFQEVYTEEYRETDKNPKGRPDVEWIWILSRKE